MFSFVYLAPVAVAIVMLWHFKGWAFHPIKAITDGTGFKNFFRVLIGRPRKFYMRAEAGFFGVVLQPLDGMKASFRQFIQRIKKS